MDGVMEVPFIDRFVYIFVIDSIQKQKSVTPHDAPGFGGRGMNLIVHTLIFALNSYLEAHVRLERQATCWKMPSCSRLSA